MEIQFYVFTSYTYTSSILRTLTRSKYDHIAFCDKELHILQSSYLISNLKRRTWNVYKLDDYIMSSYEVYSKVVSAFEYVLFTTYIHWLISKKKKTSIFDPFCLHQFSDLLCYAQICKTLPVLNTIEQFINELKHCGFELIKSGVI